MKILLTKSPSSCPAWNIQLDPCWANKAMKTGKGVKIKSSLKQITALTSRMDKLEKPSSPTTYSSKLKHKNYCYNCGIQRDHGSRDFYVGIAGHKPDATWKEIKGGSNTDQTRAWQKIEDFKIKTNSNLFFPSSPCAQHVIAKYSHYDKIKAVPDSEASGHYLTVRCDISNESCKNPDFSPPPQ